MADWDARANGPLTLRVPNHPARISELKAALTAYNSTSYTPARMFTMTYNDLLHACKIHSLTVSTTF